MPDRTDDVGVGAALQNTFDPSGYLQRVGREPSPDIRPDYDLLSGNAFGRLADQRAGTVSRSLDYNLGNVQQDDAQQAQLLQMLHRQAQGDPNSAAQQQLSRSTQQAKAGALSGAASMEGVGAGGARRMATRAQEGIQAGYAGQQRLLMQQQRQQAQTLLAQMYAQQQGQDVGLAGNMASAFNQNTGLNDQMNQFYTGAGNGDFLNRLQVNQDTTRATAGFDLENQALDAARARAAAGAVATGAASVMDMLGNMNNGKAPATAAAAQDKNFTPKIYGDSPWGSGG